MAQKPKAAQQVTATGSVAGMAIPIKFVASWANMSPDALRRLLTKFGFPTSSPLDLPTTVGQLLKLLHGRSAELLCDDDQERDLARLQKQIEIETARQRQEWLRARTELLRREWVRVSDVKERASVCGQAMRTAGEQLGQRFGPEAQDIFNGALELGLTALLTLQPTDVDIEAEEADERRKKARKKKGKK